jgi:hypothetical protein
MVVEFFNAGNTGMYVDSISASGDFAQTNDCNKHTFQGRIFLEAAGTINSICNISITFTPAATGLRTGTISVVDSAGGSPHILNLQGMGKLVLVAPRGFFRMGKNSRSKVSRRTWIVCRRRRT